jgi:hydroxylaminobenzene mutase
MHRWNADTRVGPSRLVQGVIDSQREAIRRRLAYHAAILFFLGGLTGGMISMVEAGKLNADLHMTLAAHLNGFLGAFWMLALAWTLRYSTLGPHGMNLLAWLTTGSVYANWAITSIKSLLKVHGAWTTGQPVNDAVFGLLTAFVVLPTMAASVVWIADMRRALMTSRA